MTVDLQERAGGEREQHTHTDKQKEPQQAGHRDKQTNKEKAREGEKEAEQADE